MNTIDPEMKYCPNCRDEYRPDFSTCAACALTLVSGEELLALSSGGSEQEIAGLDEITADDSLIVLQKGNLLDMKNMKRVLEKALIPSILTKDEENCAKGCCGPELYLQIRQQDGEKAYSVIKNNHEATTELTGYDRSTADAVFDQGATKTTCPACGSRFMPTSSVCPDCGLHFA